MKEEAPTMSDAEEKTGENEDSFSFLRRSKPGFKRLLAILCEKDVAVEGLSRASKSIDWLERAAVARNKKTPQEILERLAEDADGIVRSLAKDNLLNKKS